MLGPFVDPGSRTFWGGLVVSGILAMAVWWAGGVVYPRGWWRTLRHRSTLLDVQLYVGRRMLGLVLAGASLGTALWAATTMVRFMDDWWGRPAVEAPEWLVIGAYALSLFVAWDLSRFLVHLAMHRVPMLWELHQVHHSAEVLTPLTFHRIHPLESLIYQLRGWVVTSLVAALFFWVFRSDARDWTILGVHGIGFLLNVATGNLRHSEVWLSFGRWERWWISPAQHQVHHALDPRLQGKNLGTWLAAWDRLAGTWVAAEQPVAEFGVSAHERNHGYDLFSAWFGPVRAMWSSRLSGAAMLLLAGTRAQAQPVENEPVEDESVEILDDDGESIIVYGQDGTVRVAGSAHHIGEDQLEQFQYDDIERVVSAVPGVTTRGEDGFGLRPNIGIRGVNSDRSAKITLLEDGIPLVPAPYAAPAAYYFPMSTRLTGVEVFKGPAAIAHGPHTIGGAINLRTRDVPEAPAAYIDLAGGMQQTGRVHAWAGVGNGTHGLLVEGVRLQTAGFKQLDGGGPTGFTRHEAMLKGLLGLGASVRLESKLGYAHERSFETYLGLTLDDSQQTPYRRYAASAEGDMRWHRTQAELSLVAERGPLRLRTSLYHHYLTRQWTKLNRFAGGPELHDLLQAAPTGGSGAAYLAILRGEADSLTPEQQLMIGTNDRRFHSAGVQSTGRHDHGVGAVQGTTRFGIRAHGDFVQRIHSEGPWAMLDGSLERTGEPEQVFLDSDSRALALATWAQEELTWRSLRVLPGVRFEGIATQREDKGQPETEALRAAVLPGLGLLWAAARDVDIYAGGHRGFSPVAPGQPRDVQPEVSWNYELGTRVGTADRHMELTGYLNDYVNLTGQCTVSGGCIGSNVDQQFNGGRVWVGGAEAVAGYRLWLPGRWSVPVEASWTWTVSRFRTSFTSGFPQFGSVQAGDSLPYVPGHSGHARLGLEHPRVRIGLGATARTGMRDQAGQGPLTDLDVPALLLLDAAVEAQVTRGVSVYATGNNLTNSRAIVSWRPFGARPTAPLRVMAGVRVAPETRD